MKQMETTLVKSSASCLTYVAPYSAEIRPQPNRLAQGDDTVSLKALYSGISRGTERLVFSGRVPESEFQRMRGPFQHGQFPFPVGYGYAWVGEDADGVAYFGLFPHQDRIEVPKDALTRLPHGLPRRRAVLAANMETALNIIWDSGAATGDRIAVVGGGVLGLLVAGLASDMPGTEVTVVDILSEREGMAAAMGARFALPDAAEGERDVVIHTSATEAGLKTALSLAGTEAVLVEASWFGDQTPSLPLGAAFHSRRLVLRSSQVGLVSAGHRQRWSHQRRMKKALDLLKNDKYEALITDEVSFEDLPKQIPAILDGRSDGLATAVTYL